MLTLTDISTAVGVAKSYYIDKIQVQLDRLNVGEQAYVDKLLSIQRLITGLTFQINANINDLRTLKLYTCLENMIAGVTGTYVLDPDVVNPGYPLPPVVIIQQLNFGKIPFATTDEDPVLTVAAYQTNYAPLYGNNPIINLYQDSGIPFPKDMQVPDTLDYQDGDPTKNLLSISWDFAIGTTGYIQIVGQPNGQIIPPINPNPPIIDAGADQVITLPTNTAALTATGSNYTGLLWTQLSGPVTAGISTPNALVTAITGLTTAGTYVFKITATNVGNVRSDVANVVVAAQIDYVFSGIKADITPLSEASIQIGTQTPITANTNYNINFGSFGSPQFAWFAELATEPIKTVWTDTTNPLNTGGIGGGGNLFGTPTIVGAYRFYITNYATIINALFTFSQ